MCYKMLLYYIMITENKKEYFKNYRLKNIEKIKEYERKYYQAKKNNEINRMRKINENIKKDVEKLKEKLSLLHGYSEHNINILIIITR